MTAKRKENFAAIKWLSGFLPLSSSRANPIAFNWAPFFLNKFVKKPVSATETFKRGLCTQPMRFNQLSLLSASVTETDCALYVRLSGFFSSSVQKLFSCPGTAFISFLSLNMTGTREQTCIFCGLSQLKGNLSNRQNPGSFSEVKTTLLKVPGRFPPPCRRPVGEGLWGKTLVTLSFPNVWMYCMIPKRSLPRTKQKVPVSLIRASW